MLTALLLFALTAAASIYAALRYALVLPLAPRPGAPRPVDPALPERLRTHVRAIASEPHNVAHPAALERAARYIEGALSDMDYKPAQQAYRVGGIVVRNIEVVCEPRIASSATPTLIVGAHYDSPDTSPGANDNGTGVAAALEIARMMRTSAPLSARLRLVFWVNEELPYGKTPDMGAWRHAERLKASGEHVTGVIALETLGHFSDVPGSQQFPFPFAHIYPDRGNFVAFVGLPGSRALTHRATRLFRRHGDVPAIGGVVPAFVEGADLSDHWAYHQHGFPALMLTDTAPFRNPYYHQPTDLPDTVEYDVLARVTTGLHAVVRDLLDTRW